MFLRVQRLYRACSFNFCVVLREHSPLSAISWNVWEVIKFVFGNCSLLIGEGNGTPLQYSCLENPMDRRAWWAAVHGVANSHTRLSNFTFTFYFHALEKEMSTHSSVLAWRIPGMGEPGGLPSMGLQSQTRLKQLSSSSLLIITNAIY